MLTVREKIIHGWVSALREEVELLAPGRKVAWVDASQEK